MAKFTVISDPNHKAGGNAEFRVHAARCRDIERHKKKLGGMGGSIYDVEAETAAEVVKKEVAAYNADFGDGVWTEADFEILPCCKAKG